LFGFIQWDSGLTLLIEFLVALAIFIAIFMVVRRVNQGSKGRSSGSGQQPLGSMPDAASSERDKAPGAAGDRP
jgi:hypothetical protein